MITRAQMQRQLRNNGGLMTVKTIRKKYGIGSDLKDFVRKIIPNEIANVAVKAAPIVAPFNPGAAALMRGIGRFDQRGSLSDAFKQGALTYAGGRGIGMLGGAQSPEGFLGRQTFSKQGFSEGPIGRLFKSNPTKAVSKVDQGLVVAPGAPGEETLGLSGLIKKGIKALPKGVAAQLAAGTITARASLLASYFQGEFREHDPETETYEEYLAQRKEVVGGQMRTYMDNYFKFDKEYSTMTDEQKNAFVARYNVRDGGRIGFATGTGPKTEKLIAAEKLAKKEGISIAEALKRIFEEANKEGVLMIKIKDASDRKMFEDASDRKMFDDSRKLTLEEQIIQKIRERSKPKKAKGGLMSIPVRKNSEGIKELDMRKSGGFVPIGVKEKADDVPAMLSKNEFVMTADAVRAAGGGSINKGAQRMYDTMKKLESRVA